MPLRRSRKRRSRCRYGRKKSLRQGCKSRPGPKRGSRSKSPKRVRRSRRKSPKRVRRSRRKSPRRVRRKSPRRVRKSRRRSRKMRYNFNKIDNIDVPLAVNEIGDPAKEKRYLKKFRYKDRIQITPKGYDSFRALQSLRHRINDAIHTIESTPNFNPNEHVRPSREWEGYDDDESGDHPVRLLQKIIDENNNLRFLKNKRSLNSTHNLRDLANVDNLKMFERFVKVYMTLLGSLHQENQPEFTLKQHIIDVMNEKDGPRWWHPIPNRYYYNNLFLLSGVLAHAVQNGLVKYIKFKPSNKNPSNTLDMETDNDMPRPDVRRFSSSAISTDTSESPPPSYDAPFSTSQWLRGGSSPDFSSILRLRTEDPAAWQRWVEENPELHNEMARQSHDRLVDQPPPPPPLTRQRATIGRTHAIVAPRTAEVGTSIPATSHSAPPHRSAVSRRLFYNMDVPPQPVLRRQIGYSPAVYQLHEGNDERQQIRSILNEGEIGDIVRYVPNNPEGYREFRIVFSENPGAAPNTKILQEID